MVEIRIKGPPKSGKSNLAARITNMLRRCGYRVRISDGDKVLEEIQDEDPNIHVYTKQATGKESASK